MHAAQAMTLCIWPALEHAAQASITGSAVKVLGKSTVALSWQLQLAII